MGSKVPAPNQTKKAGKTLKEKRAVKQAKRADRKSGSSS
jgi:hypothetical protein